MSRINGVLVFLVVASLISGCASVGLNRDEYYDRVSNVTLGMSKADFSQLFPEAIPRGARQYPAGAVEVMEVSYQYYAFLPTGNNNRNEVTGMEGQPQWFYFYNGNLIQYGNPEDWPQNPDLIIENRAR